jgi:hypothetical protein
MAKEYVDYRDSAYFVAGTRVSLDSVVHAFLRGESPEGVLESFPALTLEQIFGSLSYYLGIAMRLMLTCAKASKISSAFDRTRAPDTRNFTLNSPPREREAKHAADEAALSRRCRLKSQDCPWSPEEGAVDRFPGRRHCPCDWAQRPEVLRAAVRLGRVVVSPIVRLFRSILSGILHPGRARESCW